MDELWKKCWLVAVLTAGLSRSATIPFGNGPRLSVADWTNYNYHEPQGPGTYAFGYDIEDPATNNVQFRNEERHPNGTVTGSYGYVEPDGNVRIINYVADEKGYRATEEKGMKLSMLKPIPLQDSPFFSPGTKLPAFRPEFDGTSSPQDVQDQRITPLSRFNTPIVASPDRYVLFNQLDDVHHSDLFEPSRFDHYPQEYYPGGEAVRFQDYNEGGYFGDPRLFLVRNFY